MSESIQPAASVADSLRESESSRGATAPQSTPGVSHESEAFDLWLIVKVGIGLAATALLVQLLAWWLLGGLEKVNTRPSVELSALAKEEAEKPFGQRLDDVPPPHLEGIERESSVLIVRTEKREEKRFYAAVEVRVRIGKEEKARLFDLREGQRVTLTYYMPNGVDGGVGVVTAITSPASEKLDTTNHREEMPDRSRMLNAEIVKVEPRSIAAAREWAEVRMKQYGWTDRDKQIAHVPVEKAMDAVLQSPEFRADGKKPKGDGRLAAPSRSSSGRASVGGTR